MKLRVYRKEQQIESRWSGGKTLELAIFPEGAKYLDRDFLWRLSTADSDRDESSFTKLPDYDRILMVLEGDVVLVHGEERSAHLQALEQDSFDGAIKTKCFGKLLRDYNLIYIKGALGRMKLMKLKEKASAVPMRSEAAGNTASYGIFCLEGYTVVSCGDSSEMLHPGEQAVVDFKDGVTEDIMVMGEGQCILTEVVMPVPDHAKAGAAGGDDLTGAGTAGAPKGSAGLSKGTSGSSGSAGPSGIAADGSGPAGAAGANIPGAGTDETGREGDSGAEDSSAFADYLTSLKLYFGRNRWAMIMRREGRARMYYDRALVQAIRKLERWYIAELIWLVGVSLCFLPAFIKGEPVEGVIPAIVFTVIHLLGIVPALYMMTLPRPYSRHMKRVEDLNAAERAYLKEETSEDPRLEKLMNKYRSDDDNYFGDESSPLYRLVRRK